MLDYLIKEASDMAQNGFAYGYQMYHLFKAAAEGDPEAQATIDQATQQAAMDQAAAQQAPAQGAEPQGDGSTPGTIGPNGMMVCPNCGTQMTPSLDLKCPACGFDVSQVLAQAASQEQPPAPGGGTTSPEQATTAPPEQVAAVANEVKQAALRDPNFMQMLIDYYGHLV